jgi:hypothetical protein
MRLEASIGISVLSIDQVSRSVSDPSAAAQRSFPPRNHGNVGQVQNLRGTGFIHGRSYAVQITAFNPTAQSGAIDFRPFCACS